MQVTLRGPPKRHYVWHHEDEIFYSDGATPISIHIQNLPAEIIGKIIVFIPPEHLKRFRLASRALNDFAKRELFRVVNLKVNMESFTRLENISHDPSLATYVEEVFYDGSLLPWQLDDFEVYQSDGVGRGFTFTWTGAHSQAQPSESRKREEFRHQIAESQLYSHYQNYCEYLDGQKFLHRGSNEVDLLTESFKRLPNLSRIEFLSGATEANEHLSLRKSTRRNTVETVRCGYVARATLINPHVTHRLDLFHVKRSMALMRAAVSADCKVKHFTAHVMDLLRMDNKSEDLKDTTISKFLGGLDSFTMDIGDNGPTEALARLLENARNVKSLELAAGRYDLDASRMADVEFSKVTQMRSYWPHLLELALGKFVIERAEFTNFLVQHASTLRILKLSDMQITGSSFVEILELLATKMRLKRVKLDGQMIGEQNEKWYLKPSSSVYSDCCTPAMRKKTCCLLHRVERYIVEGNSSPFKQRCEGEGGRAGLATGNMVWSVDDDETFQRYY